MSKSTPRTTERNTFTRPGFIISAALIAALLAAVIVLLLVPRGNDNSNAASAPSNETNTSAPATPADVEESVCGLPSSAETALGAPPAAKWELVGTFAAPTDPETVGPGVIDENGIRSCFAHSPTGALYAAVNLWALGSDPSKELGIAEQLTAPGPGRDAAIAAARSDAPGTPREAGVTVQIAGFQIAYTSERAIVDLAFRANTGALGSATTTLEWLEGDWKGVVGSGGEPLDGVEGIRDLSGFIPWTGA
jgi:hypothetical protein